MILSLFTTNNGNLKNKTAIVLGLTSVDPT